MEIHRNSPEMNGNLLKSIEFLNSDKSIAGVFSNQRGMYYDMWTLRHKTICPVDVWEEILDYKIKNKVTDEMAYEYTLKKRNLSKKKFTYLMTSLYHTI